MNAMYTGTVWHARYARFHAFHYRLFMVWLDLDRLDEAFRIALPGRTASPPSRGSAGKTTSATPP